MYNDFDRATRHAVKADPAGVLRWVFPKLSLRWRFVRWFDAQSAPRPGEPDRRCDTIAALTDDANELAPRAVVLELFTASDSDADDRLLEYIGRYRRELRHGPRKRDRYLFLGGLLFLTGGPRQAGWTADLPDEPTDETWTVFRPKALRVARESAVATLDAIEENRLSSAVLAFVPLMKGGQTRKLVRRWRPLAEAVKDENQRKTLGDVAVVHAQLTKSRELWKKELEGFAMNESISMREVREEKELETKRTWLIEVVAGVFRQQVPQDIHTQIQQQTDVGELDRWLALALSTTTLAKFREAIGA